MWGTRMRVARIKHTHTQCRSCGPDAGSTATCAAAAAAAIQLRRISHNGEPRGCARWHYWPLICASLLRARPVPSPLLLKLNDDSADEPRCAPAGSPP